MPQKSITDVMKMLNMIKPSNGQLYLCGNYTDIDQRLQSIREQNIPINEANILIFGKQIKQRNSCCIILTVIFESILFVPLLFLFCNWWKRMVNQAYEVPFSTYLKLQTIICNSSIRSIEIKVQDNLFDQRKAKLIYKMLYQSEIKCFTFKNIAPTSDFNQKEYSDFYENMKLIKSLPLRSKILWK